jgi:uncharacterized protein
MINKIFKTNSHCMLVQTNRQPLLDVFRGFAIFGIFFINITIMHSMMMYQDGYHAQFQDGISELIKRILQLFFYNKFFPIFSFLFGLGLSMQMAAKINQGKSYIGFFSRRMLLLFLFGMAHMTFLWSGDVIHLYAALGVLCLFFIRLKAKTLMALAILTLAFPFYDNAAIGFSELFSPALDSALLSYGEQGVIDTLTQGNYADAIMLRWREYLANLPMLLFYLAPMALAMFLLGIAAGKSKHQFASAQWLQSTRLLAISTLVLTTSYRLVFLWVLPETELYRNELLRPLWFKLMFLSDVLFGLCYLWLMACLWHSQYLTKLLMPFSYVGRMALSNYLFHSVIGLVLFTHIGFSLYQSLSPLQCFTLALVSFFVQALLSKLWLSHFQYGPLEWLWRCGSYLSFFPMRIDTVRR